MKTVTKTFYCTILTGFVLVLVGCGEKVVPVESPMSPQEVTLETAVTAVGGVMEHDEDDNETELVRIRMGNSQKVDDKWLDEQTDKMKKISNLKFIDLLDTKVTAKGVAKLKKALGAEVEIQSSFDK